MNSKLVSAAVVLSLVFAGTACPAKAGGLGLTTLAGMGGGGLGMGAFGAGRLAMFGMGRLAALHRRRMQMLGGATAFGGGTPFIGNGLTGSGMGMGSSLASRFGGFGLGSRFGGLGMGSRFGGLGMGRRFGGLGMGSRFGSFGMGNRFGYRGLSGADARLFNQQQKIQNELAAGNLSPGKTAFLQNRLSQIQNKETNLNSLLGTNLTNQQNRIQQLLASGNLSASQTSFLQNRLTQLQNQQSALTGGGNPFSNPSVWGWH